MGVYDGTRTFVEGFGRRSPADPRPPDADTVFEIGSVTKPMTGVLLADAVLRGHMALDDDAQTYLPDERLPRHAGGSIRLIHLATYSAGLPWMPTNWIPVNEGTYTPAMWRAFLAGYALEEPPGTRFRYGNVGFGVLGDALEAREGLPLASLFRERLFRPLGMDHSWLLRGRPPNADVAQGYDEEGAPVPLDFDVPIQAACCAVESTAHDLLQFLRAHLEPTRANELGPALDMALVRRRHAEDEFGDLDVGLGWFVRRADGIAIKGGLMRGYRASIVLDRRRRIAGVVLAADATFPADRLALSTIEAVVLESDHSCSSRVEVPALRPTSISE